MYYDMCFNKFIAPFAVSVYRNATYQFVLEVCILEIHIFS